MSLKVGNHTNRSTAPIDRTRYNVFNTDTNPVTDNMFMNTIDPYTAAVEANAMAEVTNPYNSFMPTSEFTAPVAPTMDLASLQGLNGYQQLPGLNTNQQLPQLQNQHKIYTDKYTQPDAGSRLDNFRLMQTNARAAAQASGLPEKLIMAQQIQENGWDKKKLTGANNYFNIKADKSWKGNKSQHRVWEIENGKKVWKDEWFRDYENPEQSAQDYAKFLKVNPRYGNVFGKDLSAEQVAVELQKAGYATDPDYAEGMINIMNGRTFQQLSNSLR